MTSGTFRQAAVLFATLAWVVAPPLAAQTSAATGRGWDRTDLWLTPPKVLRGEPQAFAAVLGRHGADLPAPPARPGIPQAGAIRTAPRVRALRQEPSTLGWRLHLGREPYLAFTPLADEKPCPAIATVAVARPGDAEATVWSAPTPQTPSPTGPQVTVDLAAWAGTDVELRLDVRRRRNGPRGCAMLWGSPEVVSRGAPARSRRAPKGPPNVLLIGADTLRADALGGWGRRPSPTPALDALAAESDVWLDAYSTVNSTNPSFASIMTGLFVQHHGVRDLATPLPDASVTLAERLGAAGFDTFAVIAAQHLNPQRSGLGQGFGGVATAVDTSSATLAVDQAIDWLQRPRERPFFLWLHLFDPHTPHMAPDPFALGRGTAAAYGMSPVRAWREFRTAGVRAFRQPDLGADRDLYLGEVAYLDRELDRLLGFLRSRGQLGDTLVAFVADHGENLEDHGVMYRHAGLWDTTTHVPLMIRWPDREARREAQDSETKRAAQDSEAKRGARDSAGGRRLRGLVQTIDLFPTLLAAAGAKAPASDGRDLRDLVGRARDGRPAVFAEQADGRGASVRTTAWCYFVSVGSRLVPTGVYLYDLARDPQELVNVAGKGRREEGELRAMLGHWLRGRRPAAPPGKLTAEEEAALRALGYD